MAIVPFFHIFTPAFFVLRASIVFLPGRKVNISGNGVNKEIHALCLAVGYAIIA